MNPPEHPPGECDPGDPRQAADQHGADGRHTMAPHIEPLHLPQHVGGGDGEAAPDEELGGEPTFPRSKPKATSRIAFSTSA